MPRHATGSWDDKSKRYYSRIGDIDPETGKRRPVMLKDERGKPIAFGDHQGKAAAIQRILASREEQYIRSQGATVSDLIEAYIRWHEASGSRDSTIEGHKFHLYKFEEFAWKGEPYGARAASTIRLADLTRFRKAMEQRGVQTGTVRNAYMSILACWRWASRPVEDREPERLLEMNPFEGLARPKTGKGRRLVLPFPTIRALLEFAEERNARSVHPYKALDWRRVIELRLIAESGCRPSEAVMLRRDWVHLDQRGAVIPASVTKTSKEDRLIILSDRVTTMLREIWDDPNTHPEYVFCTVREPQVIPPERKRLTYWFTSLRRAARKAGIELPNGTCLYTLRHSFVSHARSMGYDRDQLAFNLGHSTQVQDSTYAHPQLTTSRAFIDEINRRREAELGK